MVEESWLAMSDEQPHKEEAQYLLLPSIEETNQVDQVNNENKMIDNSQKECNGTLPTCLSTSTMTSNPYHQDFIEDNKPNSFDNCSYNYHMVLSPAETPPTTSYEDNHDVEEENGRCILTHWEVELIENSSNPVTKEEVGCNYWKNAGGL
jgi:hypothetical protein